MQDIRLIIRQVLSENKLYPSSVETSLTKKLSDSSDETKNLIAIFGLFRQQKPFNQVGDINKISSKEELEKLYDNWLENTIKELIKTNAFLDNKALAIKYVTAYKDNIRKIGQQARPFSVKNPEELVDLVNNNSWIKEKVSLGGATTIYSPADSDVIYKDEDIWIVKGDTKSKCVNYGAGKSWCITKPDLNYYTTYRIQHGATIFFCMQPNVKGPEHTFVIMNYGDRGYAIADETNAGDRHGGPSLARSWSRIESEIPNLKGKEKYFKYVPVTGEEKRYSELVSKEYDGSDFGDYIIRQTENLYVNGGLITPEDFVRDYVAHGNHIFDNQFSGLSDEIKNSVIESGFILGDSKFEILNQAQKKRYLNVQLKIGNSSLTGNQFLQLDDNSQNQYISELRPDNFYKMLYEAKDPDKIINIFLKNPDFVENIDSEAIYQLLLNSKDPESLVNTLIQKEDVLKNLNSDGARNLLRFTTQKNVVIDKIMKNKNLVVKIGPYVLETIFSYSNKDKNEIINTLIQNDEFVSNLDLQILRILLLNSNNPDSVVSKLIDNRDFASIFNEDMFIEIYNFVKNKEEIVDKIIKKTNFKNSLGFNSLSNILASVSNKDMLINKFLNVPEIVSQLEYHGFQALLAWASDASKLIDTLINSPQFVSNLNDDMIFYTLLSSNEPDKVIKKIGKKGEDYMMNIEPSQVNLLLKKKNPEAIKSLLKKYGKLPESVNEQFLRKIVRNTLMDEC